MTNPPYTEVFERGYPPREAVPSFFQSQMNWSVREDERGCKFLHRVRGGGKGKEEKGRRRTLPTAPLSLAACEALFAP